MLKMGKIMKLSSYLSTRYSHHVSAWNYYHTFQHEAVIVYQHFLLFLTFHALLRTCIFFRRFRTMGTVMLTHTSTLLQGISPASPGWSSVATAFTTLPTGLYTCKIIMLRSSNRFPVLLSRPSKDGFARLDGHLGKIARLTPVFL